PFLSSFLDAGFVKWNHWGTQSYWLIWRMRFFSNVLAELTLVPVIISWSLIDFSIFRKASIGRYVELTALLLGLWFVTFTVFLHTEIKFSPLWVYLPVPFLLWAATRFGFGVLSLSIVIVTFMSTWGAVHGLGPFNNADPVQNAFSIQMFLIVFSVPLLLF